MKEIREYKTTCLGCGQVKHFPYVNFENQFDHKGDGTRSIGCAGESALIGASSLACLPLGCLFGSDLLTNRVKKAQFAKMTPEERKKNYCEAVFCLKCHSRRFNIEVLTHEIDG